MVGWLLAIPAGAAASGSQTTLTVSVVDQGDVAVGGATVTATWDDGESSATTASNGQAFVDVPENEDVELDIEHEDFVKNNPLEVDDASGQDVTIQVALKGDATVTVTSADGQRLENANVEFRQDGDEAISGTTASDGTFSTGTIEQGHYEVVAVKPGYYLESETKRIGIDSEQSFELERGTTRLEMTVLDTHFESPETLENARFHINDAKGEVASVRADGGTADFSVGVNTEYTVTATKDGYVEASEDITVRESDASVEVSTQRVPALTVEARNGRVVVGETTSVTVLNAYGEPVEDAEVNRDGQTVGETDAVGELTVTVEANGDNQFTAARDGVESEPIAVEGVDPNADDAPDLSDDDGDDSGIINQEVIEERIADADGGGFGSVVAILALLSLGAVFRRR